MNRKPKTDERKLACWTPKDRISRSNYFYSCIPDGGTRVATAQSRVRSRPMVSYSRWENEGDFFYTTDSWKCCGKFQIRNINNEKEIKNSIPMSNSPMYTFVAWVLRKGHLPQLPGFTSSLGKTSNYDPKLGVSCHSIKITLGNKLWWWMDIYDKTVGANTFRSSNDKFGWKSFAWNCEIICFRYDWEWQTT